MTDSVQDMDPGRCMKCGFCMSVCPVYQVDHREAHVARGRNMLVRLAEKGQIPLDETYEQCLDQCLLCGRCLDVCVAKIPSPAITVTARNKLLKSNGLSFSRRLIYRGILRYRPLMARVMGMISLVPWLTRKEGRPIRHMADIMSVFSGGIYIPRLSRPFLSKRLSHPVQPPEGVQTRGRAAFFPGCGTEFFFADAGEDTAMALARTGFEVIYPKGHTCCGMAVHNAGDLNAARRMAERNIKVLSEFDHIVTGCATCGSTLKAYGEWFSEDDALKQDALSVARKVSDLSEFLVNQGFQGRTDITRPVRVTYHSPCHLTYHQGVSDYPRHILNSLKDVDFIEMEGADNCCGLGGAFGINHRDISLAIQSKKMAAIQDTGAEIVVTSCPGCLIQLMDGVRRHGMDVDVVHLSRLLK